MNAPASLTAIVDPVISLVPRLELRESLRRAFSEEQAAVSDIERLFQLLPSSVWSKDLLSTFAGSWKATHLKMLAIYGLSCRLQRTADAAEEADRSNFHLAAARNAATSYEDLGLDFDAHTHAELFDDFAEALVGDDGWQLRRYRLPEARQFTSWVYRGMVVAPIQDGLLTNMFSEIYNHGEYSLALPSADAYFRCHTQLTGEERRKASLYIAAHVEGGTEADHFLIVGEALERYLAASGTRLDTERATSLFRTYLRNLAPVMRSLTALMRIESSGRAAASVAVGAGQE